MRLPIPSGVPGTGLAVAALAAGLGMMTMCERGEGPPADEALLRERRLRMVAEQIEARGIRDPAVLAALRAVPRHRFLPHSLEDLAYDDEPQDIGDGQTISQPYVVAQMTELIRPRKDMRVLEIGTGSGYQAAVLAEIVREVDTIEIVPELARRAEATLSALGYRNVRVRRGDGFAGWPERAPFDAILLTAAPPDRVPPPLLAQLRPGGRLVAPVGRGVQDLQVITRTGDTFTTEVVSRVLFVPMTGRAQRDRPD